MVEPFVTIEGVEYQAGDWFRDKHLVGVTGPSVIVNVFDDMSETYIIVRSPYLEHEMIDLPEFIQRVKLARYAKIRKPFFRLGQELKNRFTEESIEIKDVPHQTNEEDGEYMYFALSFTPTYGYNYKCKSESTIKAFFESEGVDEV